MFLIVFGLCLQLLAGLQISPDTTRSVWNFEQIRNCDVGFSQMNITPQQFVKAEWTYPNNIKVYSTIKNGDVVWSPCRFLGRFVREVLPTVMQPFILFVASGDESFPNECDLDESETLHLVNHKNVSQIFAVNYDSGNSVVKLFPDSFNKVNRVPIGLDFHTGAYKYGSNPPANQEKELFDILAFAPPLSQRKRRIFVDFHHTIDTLGIGNKNRYKQFNDTRTSIFAKVNGTGLVDSTSTKLHRHIMWATKSEYAFSISPWGNGLDCHRTWEDLILGLIVIVKTSCLDKLYERLSVVIVKDWSEITEENLRIWHTKFTNGSVKVQREKLTNHYWASKMSSAAALLK